MNKYVVFVTILFISIIVFSQEEEVSGFTINSTICLSAADVCVPVENVIRNQELNIHVSFYDLHEINLTGNFSTEAFVSYYVNIYIQNEDGTIPELSGVISGVGINGTKQIIKYYTLSNPGKYKAIIFVSDDIISLRKKSEVSFEVV